MFGTNTRVGKLFFAHAPKKTLKVTSIFFTIQGEGPLSGQPCIFIRLTKCNLACSFCDAQFEQGQDMTFEEIRAKIYQLICEYWNDRGLNVPLWILPEADTDLRDPPYLGPYGCGLVITGGEPSLQEENLFDFLSEVSTTFKWMQIETNGIIEMTVPGGTIMVVSPKCTEKDGKATKYLQPNQFVLRKADCLKFVMSADPTSPYSEVPEWALKHSYTTGTPIYVSPMNIYKSIPQRMKLLMGKEDKTLEERSTADEIVSFWENGVLDLEVNRQNHEYAARYAMTHGCRFQVQTHLLASLA